MEDTAKQWGWLETAALLSVLLLALIFRAYGLDKVPPAFNGDEAHLALDAQSILAGNFFLIGPNEGTSGALWLYLLAGTFGIFGSSIAAARGLSVTVSIAGILMAYIFTRLLLSATLTRFQAVAIAALVALYLSVARWYVELSRIAFSANLGVLVQVSFFAALWWALRSHRRLPAFIAGALLGLTVFTYIPFRFTPFVALPFILLDALARWRRGAFLRTRFKTLLAIAAIGGLIYAPLLAIYATGGLGDKTRSFTVFNPIVNQGDPWGMLFRTVLGNVAGFLPFIPRVGNTPVARGIDDLSIILFLIGLAIALWRWRRPEYLFLAVWWALMLLPSIIGPEGATPHLRRALGTAIPTFTLVGLGLVLPLAALARQRPAWRRWVVAGGVVIALIPLWTLARQTYVNYYLHKLDSEAAALVNHIYDFELAEVMVAEGDAQTGYILPVDTAAGAIFPESSTLAFLYQGRGQAEYAYIWDNETALFPDTQSLLAGKDRIGVVKWKASKHTGADPRHLFDYVLERAGTFDGVSTHKYVDISYYQLDSNAEPVSPAELTAVPKKEGQTLSGQWSALVFGGQFALTGAAIAPETPADEPLWVELAWRKLDAKPLDLQVGLWLEDGFGHIVGRADHPLLSDQLHRYTADWEIGAEERDFALISADPGTPPGDYHLKAVLYWLDDAGQSHRLAPLADNVGADLALSLGVVRLLPPPKWVPFEEYHIPPTKYEVVLGNDNLHLLSVSGLPETLHPGDQGTMTLWWRSMGHVPSDGTAALQLSNQERTIALSSPQLLGGEDFPTQEWAEGTTIRQFLDYALPADLPAGEYQAQLVMTPFDYPLISLGYVTVAGRPRIFDVPQMGQRADASLSLRSLKTSFGGKVALLGYDIALEAEAARLTLYWRSEDSIPVPYKVFVHLLDESGNIAAQMDREPQAGEAPTTSWLPGEVIVDEMTIPVSDLERVKTITVGLYNPVDGKRLSVLETGETSYEIRITAKRGE